MRYAKWSHVNGRVELPRSSNTREGATRNLPRVGHSCWGYFGAASGMRLGAQHRPRLPKDESAQAHNVTTATCGASARFERAVPPVFIGMSWVRMLTSSR